MAFGGIGRGLILLAAVLTAAAAPRNVQAPRSLPDWFADPFPSTYRPLPRHDLLITDATILDGRGGRIEHGAVLLRDGKVAAVGTGLAAPAGVATIDAHGRFVTPGIVDPHSHDGTYVLPLTDIDRDSSDVSELSSPDVADIRIETAINVQDTAFGRALAAGVTTLQVLPGSDPIFSGRSVVLHPIPATHVAAMKFPGAAEGFKMACGENPKSEDVELRRGPTSRQGEIAYIRQSFLDARQYEARWQAWAAGRLKVEPRRDLKAEALLGLLAGRIRLHMHCYRSDDMAVMLGVAQEFGFRIAAFHHATEAYKIPSLLKAAGTCAAVWGDWWGFKMEALDAIRANAPLLDRAGVCVAMHSDSPYSGQHLNLDAAVAGAAGRALGVATPPERMIAWITSGPARLLGLEDRIGTLAPGYDADLVLWSGDPFSIYAHPDLVLIDGAVAYDRAHLPAHPSSDFELGRPAVAHP